MKRLQQRIRPFVASLASVACLLLLFAVRANADNYCNNPVPPCSPDNPSSACYKPPEPSPKCEPRQCGKCTKSPCYVGSGVYVRDAEDLRIPTVGFEIDVARHYTSAHTIDGDLGYGWTSSLSTRLYYAAFLKAAPSTYEKHAYVRLADGVLYRFVENADGSFTPPAGSYDTLVANGDGTFDLWLQQTRSRMHFGANGNLLAVIDDFGNTQTWTYVADRLSRVEDSSGSGRYIDITYGADGRISDVTDHTGRNIQYTYDSRGVLVSSTNQVGQVTSYSYVNGKYVPILNGVSDHWSRVVTTVVYDAQDRVTSYTEGGETFTYTYNYNGSATTTAKTDSSGNQWQYPFAADGVVTDSRPPGGGPAEHIDYYPSGLVQTQTDATGVKTHYTYNSRGNPATITADYQGPTAVEWRVLYDSNFPDSPISIKPYDPANGLIHPHWQGQTLEYYPPGSTAPGALHRQYILDNDGTTARLASEYTYDSHGRELTVRDGAGNELTYTYDSAGNIATITRPSNNAAGLRPVLSFTYDSLGRVLTFTNPEGKVTSYTWDALDRLETFTLPLPSPSSTLTYTTTHHYDEFDSGTQLLFIRIVDSNGRATRTGYDQFQQALRSIDQDSNLTRTIYTKGLMTALIDPNGYTTTYAYDARRRLSTVTFPDGTSETTTYTVDDRVATKRDRSNQTVTFTYDRHKRAASKSYPNGSSVTQTYVGQKLTQVTDTFASPSETHTFTYDASFRVTSTTQGPRGTTQLTYTANGLPATVTAAGATATYDYYADGSIKSVLWSPVTGAFEYEYALDGKLQTIAFPNGQSRDYTYDGQGRLTQVANTHPVAGNLATFAYGYDLDAFTGLPTMRDMRTSVIANVPALALSNALTNFGYNNRYQLDRASYPGGAPYGGLVASWTYDAAGHRTSETLNGVTANSIYTKLGGNPLNSPRLQSDGANAYTYDARGNVITRTGTRGNYTFTYDDEGRLRSVGGDETATYAFDYRGRRTVKTVGGVTTSYVYVGDHPVAETGGTSAQYLFGPGIDQPLAMVRGGQVYYYSIDGTDSVVLLSDASGATQNTYAWDAWGSAVSRTEAVANGFGYTARELAEAGLHHYRFRSYEPAVGRFTREDPLQEWVPVIGADLFGYVSNSPMMGKDPYGLFCLSFSSRGPWVPTGKWGMGEKTRLIREEFWPHLAPPIRRDPNWRYIRGSLRFMWPAAFAVDFRYECYWQRFLVVTTEAKRKITVTTYCLCPRSQTETSYEETKMHEQWRYLETFKTFSFNVPCSFSPPKR